MKTLLIISVVTFALIFGGVAILALQVGQRSAPAASGEEGVADPQAAARELQSLQIERDRIQQEKEQIAALRQSYAVQEQVLTAAYDRMQEMVGRLEAGQVTQSAADEAAAAKLAKMYEAMTPQKAAPIIAALEPTVALDVLKRMKERQAAAVLASMDAPVAAQLSAQLSPKGH